MDIRKFNEVPAIEDRLPTEAELRGNMSLIKVDTAKYPDARVLPMKLPRVARIVAEHLNQHVMDYLARVRTVTQPDTKRKKATPR